MNSDPVFDSAWASFRSMADHSPPHVAVQQMRSLRVPEELIEQLLELHEAEALKIVELREPLGIGRENAEHWYTGPRVGDRNWPALESRLAKRLGDDAAKKIDDESSKVVAMLDHPGSSTFTSKGLVVGHVQSGKTGNFTSVTAKAADRGYRLFIVLSGVHNQLRRQTQVRMLNDVVELNPTLWHQITKPEHDFVPPANAASLLASKDQALLLVVKKNVVVLGKLLTWLRGAKEHLANVPTLIIDDEADQATIATRKINPLIADIMDCFPKVVYVGYTATPFANLLIDPADLRDFYPRDFVLSLERGAEYQGPEKLFGRNPLDGEDAEDAPGGLDMIRRIPDDELPKLRPLKRSDIGDFHPAVTPSLRRAVLWFWIATSVRRVREGEARHSSMLLHAHSDTKVHDSFAGPLRSLRGEVLSALKSADPALDSELRALWADETSRVRATDLAELEVSYEAVSALLETVVGDTKVILDHYRSTDRLDYDSGPATVIAVGGNTLSRGLTLEGLVVSVFVRTSDVYDTLLQMGRWFGYRPGYTDLPRIWMPNQMREWFTHLATVEAEMRNEIDRYLIEHKTPLELAVRIRCHPKMRVTAPAKMSAHVRAAAAYGGQLVESRYFITAPEQQATEWSNTNAGAVQTLLAAARGEGTRDEEVTSGRILWRRVPTDHVLSFLRSYQFHEKSVEADRDLTTKYIERRRAAGGMVAWNVAVIGKPQKTVDCNFEIPGIGSVSMVNRARLLSNADAPVADIKTLSGSRDEAVDLQIDTGAKLSRHLLSDLRRKQLPETGLVMLYPIDPNSIPTKAGRAALEAPGDVVWGVALVFPPPTRGGVDLPIEYDFVAADLSKVFPAAGDEDDLDVDVSVLDEDLDSDESAVSGEMTEVPSHVPADSSSGGEHAGT